MDTITDTAALDSRLGAAARAFMGRRNRLLIDGKLVDAASGKTFPDYNPATGTILVQVAEAEAEDVDRAVKAAPDAPSMKDPGARCRPPTAANCYGSWLR
jgi:hypothetical protein